MSQDTLNTNPSVPAPVVRKRNEHFFGTVLLVIIIFFILSSLLGIGWVVYSQWNNAQIEKGKPTIQTLSEPEADPVVESERQEAVTADAPASESAAQTEETKDITKEKIAILNGGAAAGSAVKLSDTLKLEKLTEITTGSTQADFTGTTVYYKKEKEGEAKVLLPLVQKTYKDAVLKEQDTTKSETATADLTIILGASS